MSEQRCDGLNRWRRQREARDIGREMCDKNGQDGKCLDECVRGDSRLHKILSNSRIGNRMTCVQSQVGPIV